MHLATLSIPACRSTCTLLLLGLMVVTPTFLPAQIPVNVVAKIGDMIGPDTITGLNAPFTDGNGVVGFTGTLTTAAGTDNFVWYDTGVIWRNSDEGTSVLTGAEGTMGVSNAGGFIYSPAVDGDDAVWTDGGLLQVENVKAPGFPAGTRVTFNSRPTMNPDGTAYWVAGFDDTGGTSTLGRVLYTAPGGPATISVVLRSDDMVDGLTIDRPSGIDFDYDLSDNNTHHIHVLVMDTGNTADDGTVYVDGSIVAREASPASLAGGGENWDNFDIVSINNSGNYIFTGDTNGGTGTDEFIAYNGTISIREGDTIDGVTLTSTAFLRAASINNAGFVAHSWSISGGAEVLFYGRANDLANSVKVLQTGDTIDDRGLPPLQALATVTDFNASSGIGPGIDLADDGLINLEVDLDFGNGDLEAIIQLQAPTLLPVELTDFRAVQTPAGVALHWTTATETDNAGFEVEMTPVGARNIAPQLENSSTAWQTLAFVAGAGTTLDAQSYTYRVAELEPGTYRFRLKQIDFDGAFEMSHTVETTVEVPGLYTLGEAFPNPFTTHATFMLAVPSEQAVQIDLYDVMGRHVRNVFNGPLPANQSRTFPIDGTGLAGGMYVYRVQTPTFATSRKVMLMR